MAELKEYPYHLITKHTLSDGSPITIRPIRDTDIEMIKEFSRHLSSELKHLNYMENFREFPQKMVTRLTQVDYKKTMTMIATSLQNNEEMVVGMVHYFSADGENSEFDMIVADAWQHKGIGTLLTESLLQSAMKNQIKSIKIMILASNTEGMMLAKHFGFVISDSDEHTVKVVIKKL